MLYVQFSQLGEKLWQFGILPKPDLASFGVAQLGPKHQTRLLFLALIAKISFLYPKTIYSMSNSDSQGKCYGSLMFFQNQIWPGFVSCSQDQTKRVYYFFTTRFVDLIFLPINHIQYIQFLHPGQKLRQFEIFPTQDLASFSVMHPNPN